MTEAQQLWVVVETDVVEEQAARDGSRSGVDIGGGFGFSGVVETLRSISHRKRVPLDAQALKSQMEGMLAIVNDLFSQSDTQTGLRLDEVELSVEINAEGQLSLVGNGSKLGNKGGIILKFTRPQ